jgi:UDP-glucose 4-epimerase
VAVVEDAANMARVLVTGAFGYLGLSVLRGLANHALVAFGHPPRADGARAAIAPEVEVVEGELLDIAGVLEQRGPFDAVIHLAGGGGPAKVGADPVAAVRTNVRGTTELAAAARSQGVKRLLFASTIAVYGTQRDHGRPYAETDAAVPDDLYGAVKEAAEHAWVALAGGTSLRIANVYGAGAGVDLGLAGAVERFARAAASGGQLSIFGTGAQRIDYVHVDDVAHAFALALDAEGSLPPFINIGGGDPISIGDLAERSVAAGRALGRSPMLERRPAPPGKSWPDRSLNIALAARALGWSPRVGYEQGITELVRMMQGAST